MKNKWRNYALKSGKVKESYIREYCNRKKSRKAGKTSNSDCFQQSRQEQKEIRGENETVREEKLVEAHQQGQQRIQNAAQRRPRTKKENISQTEGKKMKKEKESAKAHKKHEAKESKAYERKEDRKEMKKESKTKK